MTELQMHDVVRVTRDLPALGLAAGTEATIVEIYENPRLAYEIESCDEDGYTLFLGAVEPEFLERIWAAPPPPPDTIETRASAGGPNRWGRLRTRLRRR